MKNLFFCMILALFAVAWSARLDRNGDEVKIRAKRSFDFDKWFQSKKDANKKDDKKKNKGKKPSTVVTTAPYTIASTSKSPINPGNTASKMRDELLKKILKAKTTEEVDKLMKVSKELRKQIEANYTKNLPKELARVEGQSIIPAPQCGCSRQFTRVSAKHDSDPPLGVFYPHNCLPTFRCLGACFYDDLQECGPTNKSFITHTQIYVYYPYVGKFPEYKKIAIEQHEECDCLCKPKKCHDRQVFNNDVCGCRCKSEYTADKLKCEGRLVYDDDSCSCKCFIKHFHCKQSEWDENLCKCVPKATTKPQPTCAPIPCRRGMIFNKNLCICENVGMSNKGKNG